MTSATSNQTLEIRDIDTWSVVLNGALVNVPTAILLGIVLGIVDKDNGLTWRETRLISQNVAIESFGKEFLLPIDVNLVGTLQMTRGSDCLQKRTIQLS